MERISEVGDTISKHISKDHQHQRCTIIDHPRPVFTSSFVSCDCEDWGVLHWEVDLLKSHPYTYGNNASWSWYLPIILYNSLLVIIVLAAVFSHTKPLYWMKGQSLFSYSPEDEDAPFWSINYIWICAYSLKYLLLFWTRITTVSINIHALLKEGRWWTKWLAFKLWVWNVKKTVGDTHILASGWDRRVSRRFKWGLQWDRDWKNEGSVR